MKEVNANYEEMVRTMGLVGTVVPSAVLGLGLGLAKAYHVPLSALEVVAVAGLPLGIGALTVGMIDRNREMRYNYHNPKELKILSKLEKAKQRDISKATLDGALAGTYLSLFPLAAGTFVGYAFGVLSKLYQGN